MGHRKTTLRKLSPVTREYARLVNDYENLGRRLKNFEAKIADIEHDSRALKNAKQPLIDKAMEKADMPQEDLFSE